MLYNKTFGMLRADSVVSWSCIWLTASMSGTESFYTIITSIGGILKWIRLTLDWQLLKIILLLSNKFNGVGRSPFEVKQSIMNSNELVALAILNEKVVGFGCAQYFKSFCYSELQGEITELYVDEEARGKSLGILLIGFLEDLLIEYGVKNIKVLTSQNNIRAIRTYLKADYVQEEYLIFQKKVSDE